MLKKTGLSVGFLFDDTLDSNDGVAQHVKTLGAWLTGAGHDVSYLVGETKMDSWSGGKVYSLSRNLGVTFNGNKLSVPALSRKPQLKEALDENKFDVLHVMTPYSPLMSQRLINLASDGTAVVGTFHIFPSGPLSRVGTRSLRLLYGKSLKRIGAMISVSRPAADFCRKSLGIDSKIIPNPVNISAYMAKPGGGKGSKTVVFLGRLVPRKGVEELIRAFAEMSAELPDANLIIAGDGPQKAKLECLADRLGIKNQTRFLGYISESEKPALLAGAGVACFPSLYGESFGIVLVEAMAAGARVVLGGDNPGYQSVLSERPDCLVDPKNTKEFARRLKLLLSDDELASKLHKWQSQTVKQYDVSVVGPEVVAVYRQAIARLGKNSHNNSHE